MESPKSDKVRSDAYHLSGVDGRTLCGLDTEGLVVDFVSSSAFQPVPLVTCAECKRLRGIGDLVSELNELNPRARAFRVLKMLIDACRDHRERFRPHTTEKRAISLGLELMKHGAGGFDFSDSRATGALAVCVYSRDAGRCHRCVKATRRCLHPKGPRISPLGRRKMRRPRY